MNRLDAAHDLRCPVMSRGADPDMCSCDDEQGYSPRERPSGTVPRRARVGGQRRTAPVTSEPGETWAVVPGQPGYEASTHGRIRSVDRVLVDKNGRRVRLQGKVLSPACDAKGYQHVILADRASRRVHQLVLEAFVGPAPVGHDGCHNDGDASNNCLENLRWDTRSANALDMVAHGTHNRARRTHCDRRHELLGANLLVESCSDEGERRRCRACERARSYCRRHPASKKDESALADQYYGSLMAGGPDSLDSAVPPLREQTIAMRQLWQRARVTRRPDRLHLTGVLLDRAVDSSNELTVGDADSVLAQLRELDTAGRLQAWAAETLAGRRAAG